MSNSDLSNEKDKSLILSILQKETGKPNASFREGQWEAIKDAVDNPGHTILIENPGWGKSFVYLAITKLNRMEGRGLTIFISSSLSLITDQELQAKKWGFATAIVETQKKSDWKAIKEKVLENKVDILFISADRLSNSEFVKEVLLEVIGKAGLLVVDEIHSISTKSHSFRPEYRKIIQLLNQLTPPAHLLGLTATASKPVVEDIQALLGPDVAIKRGTWINPSLKLDTVNLKNHAAKLVWLLNFLKTVKGSGIIYTRNYREAKGVADWLQAHGINARASSGLTQDLDAQLTKNKLKALVTSCALSAGYDKPDLSFVVHLQKPKSLPEYFQQVGRAGRDLNEAYGIILASPLDPVVSENVWEEPVPNSGEVAAVSAALPAGEERSSEEMQKYANLPVGRIRNTLLYLDTEENPPVTKVKTKWKRTGNRYVFKGNIVKELKELRHKEREEVEEYFDTKGRKTEFLAKALGTEDISSCGKGNSCSDEPIIPFKMDEDLLKKAETYIQNNYICFPTKVTLPKDTLTQYQFCDTSKIPPNIKAEPGWALSALGENEIGKLIESDREAGHFSDILVEKFVEMLQKKGIDKKVKWVTNVPSANSNLVRDFAKRVADSLGLPYHDVFQRSAKADSYHSQQNTVYRLRNLDGALQIRGEIPDSSVLLIDDLFNSGWTLFVASALLKQKFLSESSGGEQIPKVYPAVLATVSEFM